MFNYQKKVNLKPGIAKEKNTLWQALYVFIKYVKEYVKVERIQPSQNNQNIARTKKKTFNDQVFNNPKREPKCRVWFFLFS